MFSKLDVVLWHEEMHRIKILDIKTSTRGWNQNKKNDKGTTNQLVLYKSWFAKQYNVQSIPATFILDATGTIVAKDLKGAALKAKIIELLNAK